MNGQWELPNDPVKLKERLRDLLVRKSDLQDRLDRIDHSRGIDFRQRRKAVQDIEFCERDIAYVRHKLAALDTSEPESA